MLGIRVVRPTAVLRSDLRIRRVVSAATIGILVVAISACEAGLLPGGGGVTMETVSTPPGFVSGGEALVRIRGASDSELAGLEVLVNDRSATADFAFAPRHDYLGRMTHELVGLVEGLREGPNEIVAMSGGVRVANLTISNHPITGPVFSGPQQEPFVCQTFENALGPSLDDDCSAETVVRYVYRSTGPPLEPEGAGAPDPFRPYDPDAPRPADMAETTTTDGETVDYIVRLERGTINRAVYEIAFLHRPDQPLPDPWTRSATWNGRLVYSFGGGCGAGYRQATTGEADIDRLLALGYAVASSSLNVFGNKCDDVVSAETMMMVKEHFVESFGEPVHTIGTGGSGGSAQQFLISQNYPGLLDGLTTRVSFPDGLSFVQSDFDCTLLQQATSHASEEWTEEQLRAVGGFATWEVCGGTWGERIDLIGPTGCSDVLAPALVYDAELNPSGARCGIHDDLENYFGTKAETGFANRHLDNIGVQYGLVALNDRVISVEQFLELNETIGGLDIDGNWVPERSVADRYALRGAYVEGRMNTGGGSLGRIPIIDARDYRDPTGDIHDSYRSFVTRARIAAAHGGADNMVILRRAEDAGSEAPYDAIAMMDRWLTDIRLSRDYSTLESVLRHKPDGLEDACWTPDGERVAEAAVFGEQSRCNEMYPPWGDPRIMAGGPITDDVLKCRLRSVDRDDYSIELTDEQVARLEAVFPDGVCDYDRPGVEQTVASPEGWRRY